MLKTIRLAALLSSIILLYGCIPAWIGLGAGLGIGTYKYMEGSVEGDYSLSYDSAWEATNKALANNYISVIDSINDGGRGKINAVRKDGKKIIIKLTYRMQNVTLINIRVGLLGNNEDAERLHDEIRTAAGLK